MTTDLTYGDKHYEVEYIETKDTMSMQLMNKPLGKVFALMLLMVTDDHRSITPMEPRTVCCGCCGIKGMIKNIWNGDSIPF